MQLRHEHREKGGGRRPRESVYGAGRERVGNCAQAVWMPRIAMVSALVLFLNVS